MNKTKLILNRWKNAFFDLVGIMYILMASIILAVGIVPHFIFVILSYWLLYLTGFDVPTFEEYCETCSDFAISLLVYPIGKLGGY